MLFHRFLAYSEKKVSFVFFFHPTSIHTRPMPHFLKNCTVKRSETRHTYVVCRRKQSYILCFCIKNLVFLPEIQNFASAYIHTRPMPHFLKNCTVKRSTNKHTYVVCRPEHICHLFFRTKNLVCLPEIQNFAHAYIHTQTHIHAHTCVWFTAESQHS